MFTLLTLGYVAFGAVISAIAARFGATLVTKWTGGDDDLMSQARKYASGIALVEGCLAACTPVNPLYAIFLAAATGLFTAFCLGILFAGAKVPEQYGKLLKFVDGKAGELNSELAKPETKQAVIAQITAAADYAKAKVSNLTPEKDSEETVIFGTFLLDEAKSEAEAKVDETADAGEKLCDAIKLVTVKTGGNSGAGGPVPNSVKTGAGDGGPKLPVKSSRPVRRDNNKDA